MTDVSSLLREHTVEELLLALQIVQVAKEFDCSLGEIATAIKLKKRENRNQRGYYERHREELIRKRTERKKAQRSKDKLESVIEAAVVASH